METPFEIKPYSPTIGAEIHGIDLRQPMPDATLASLRAALLEWKVLFFRDQDITTEQHLAFARRFGELEIHPFAPSKPDYPEVLAISHGPNKPGTENTWHSDVTWREKPSLGSILRCLAGPTVGGDTLFADMYAAYDHLPADIKRRVTGRVARHDFPHFRAGMRKLGLGEDKIAELKRSYPNPEHPVIRTHPETGRNGIYVNAPFTANIVDMDADESEELLQILYRQAAVPEFQCRFRWEPNSIAFWDNRACQHYASSDYWPQKRTVERVTVIGDSPFYREDAVTDDVTERPFKGAVERMAAS